MKITTKPQKSRRSPYIDFVLTTYLKDTGVPIAGMTKKGINTNIPITGMTQKGIDTG